jgi:hypothetical protein
MDPSQSKGRGRPAPPTSQLINTQITPRPAPQVTDPRPTHQVADSKPARRVTDPRHIPQVTDPNPTHRLINPRHTTQVTSSSPTPTAINSSPAPRATSYKNALQGIYPRPTPTGTDPSPTPTTIKHEPAPGPTCLKTAGEGTNPRPTPRATATEAASEGGNLKAAPRVTNPKPALAPTGSGAALGGTKPRQGSSGRESTASNSRPPSRDISSSSAPEGTNPRHVSLGRESQATSSRPPPKDTSSPSAPKGINRRHVSPERDARVPTSRPNPRDTGAQPSLEENNLRRAQGETSQISQIRKLSLLEALPEPLLQKIFFCSLEPNMARTSPSINKTLSTETVYKLLILFALFDNDDRFPVSDSHFEPTTYQYLTAAERLRLQKDVLECQWCTLSRIRKYIPNLMHLQLERQWEIHRRAQVEGIPMINALLPARDDLEGLKTFFQGGHRHRRADKEPCTTINVRHLRHNHRDHWWRDGIKINYVPCRALNPRTWSDNQATNYILFFRQHEGAQLTFDSDALYRGMETAVMEHNFDALYILWGLRQEGGFASSEVSGVYDPDPVPDRLLHLACLQRQEHDWIAEFVLCCKYRDSEIPHHDPTVLNWVFRPGGSPFRISLRNQCLEGHLRWRNFNSTAPFYHRVIAYAPKLTGGTICPYVRGRDRGN